MNPFGHDVLAPFYKQALTVNTETTPTEVLTGVLAEDFQSQNNNEVKDKATLIKQFEFLWKLIPDLKFEPKQKVVEGNTVVIRSIASGTPKGNFMGIECDGTKSFCIDTTDIHTIENGQIKHVYHIEDWASAMKQLKA
ncbi:hypothetical protein GCM10009007_15190 [Formosimonas limnophila]|uniref:SnoaL-like polyketide cyclase n=1 Tax=Formosimonas limnophila TaxID=1384487 RepID=A0A8J3FYP8_9BURK|nr:ester cyclase [Formosimonas limnophila]GHA75033.1 hypothetical protein GCM10009007_15190 [Formosimonas limnophila]